MLKIREGNYKGYRFQFAYSNATELKLLILQFQNTVDFVFNEVYNSQFRVLGLTGTENTQSIYAAYVRL